MDKYGLDSTSIRFLFSKQIWVVRQELRNFQQLRQQNERHNIRVLQPHSYVTFTILHRALACIFPGKPYAEALSIAGLVSIREHHSAITKKLFQLIADNPGNKLIICFQMKTASHDTILEDRGDLHSL